MFVKVLKYGVMGMKWGVRRAPHTEGSDGGGGTSSVPKTSAGIATGKLSELGLSFEAPFGGQTSGKSVSASMQEAHQLHSQIAKTLEDAGFKAGAEKTPKNQAYTRATLFKHKDGSKVELSKSVQSYGDNGKIVYAKVFDAPVKEKASGVNDVARFFEHQDMVDRSFGRKEEGLAKVLKYNPYHDSTGAFSTRGSATFTSVGEKFRSSNARDKERSGRLKTKVIPTRENAKARAKLQKYMDGYSNNLKNPQEKAYVQARVQQMINGISRPSGMSGKFGLTRQRVVQFEMLTLKIFTAGRSKIDV